MSPDFMLVGVASLIFVAVIIAALTASGESQVPDRRKSSASGTRHKDPANTNRHGKPGKKQ